MRAASRGLCKVGPNHLSPLQRSLNISISERRNGSAFKLITARAAHSPSSSSPAYQGGCGCGAVRFEMQGEPTIQVYCHCEDCQRVSGHPVRATLVWLNTTDFMAAKTAAASGDAPVLRITQGWDSVTKYNHTPGTDRHFCKTCGTHVFAYAHHPRATSTTPINLDDYAFKPMMHVNCTHAKRGSLAALISDGLPKYKRYPGEGAELIA